MSLRIAKKAGQDSWTWWQWQTEPQGSNRLQLLNLEVGVLTEVIQIALGRLVDSCTPIHGAPAKSELGCKLFEKGRFEEEARPGRRQARGKSKRRDWSGSNTARQILAPKPCDKLFQAQCLGCLVGTSGVKRMA